ncbi:hypothetical protein WN51_06148 [Melipona quadrifasciata]|uniref:Uncharacterized protein n=1 Tax=Melipona quadrifasciata TaxID=166423 RepID=A0A0N0BBZ1_9HYME|nr:hypothetical protein WN51_06148 [Melipona quadrifasciata]
MGSRNYQKVSGKEESREKEKGIDVTGLKIKLCDSENPHPCLFPLDSTKSNF